MAHYPKAGTADAYVAFLRELAAVPDRSGLTDRMEAGHEPDPHGWCRHAAHSHRWERHPCSTLRLVALLETIPPR